MLYSQGYRLVDDCGSTMADTAEEKITLRVCLRTVYFAQCSTSHRPKSCSKEKYIMATVDISPEPLGKAVASNHSGRPNSLFWTTAGSMVRMISLDEDMAYGKIKNISIFCLLHLNFDWIYVNNALCILSFS